MVWKTLSGFYPSVQNEDSISSRLRRIALNIVLFYPPILPIKVLTVVGCNLVFRAATSHSVKLSTVADWIKRNGEVGLIMKPSSFHVFPLRARAYYYVLVAPLELTRSKLNSGKRAIRRIVAETLAVTLKLLNATSLDSYLYYYELRAYWRRVGCFMLPRVWWNLSSG